MVFDIEVIGRSVCFVFFRNVWWRYVPSCLVFNDKFFTDGLNKALEYALTSYQEKTDPYPSR
jgi:hypothetical protein